MDRVWGLEAEPENRTLDVHIRTLRAKLGPAGPTLRPSGAWATASTEEP